MTITPEIIAFVVAMAGMILPAMAIEKIREKNYYHEHQIDSTYRKYEIEGIVFLYSLVN